MSTSDVVKQEKKEDVPILTGGANRSHLLFVGPCPRDMIHRTQLDQIWKLLQDDDIEGSVSSPFRKIVRNESRKWKTFGLRL
jgi:hypothetical protein